MSNDGAAAARAMAAYAILGIGGAVLYGWMKGFKMDKCSVTGCKNYPRPDPTMVGGLPLCQEHWRSWEGDERTVKLMHYLRDAEEAIRFWQCRVAGVMNEHDENRIEGKFNEALRTLRRIRDEMSEHRDMWLAAHKVEAPAPAEPPPFEPPPPLVPPTGSP